MQVLVTVAMGNDYYDSYRTGREYGTGEIDALVDRYAVAVRGVANYNVVVIGGSCDVWGFGRWMDGMFLELYERHRDKFMARFGYHGFKTYTGAQELRGISVADRIGHLDVSSWQILFRAYVVWFGYRRAKL